MVGYFGHKMRLLAGLEPVESVVLNGKYNEVEPAIVTTYLEAFPDGTIKHQTEFLDTASGQRAARMYASRVGGFSSAIDEKRPEFFGFDWVVDPNYSTNRPYSLDSASNLTFDSVLAEAHQEEEDAWLRIIAEKDALIADLRASLDSVSAENEELISIAASVREKSVVLLDSASSHLIVSNEPANRILKDADFFKKSAVFPGFIEQIKPGDSDNSDIMSMMGLS